MKSKKLDSSIEKEEKFPCLMIGDSGSIVLVISEDKYNYIGTIVYSEIWTLGFYSECWSKNKFRLYKGKIELSNE